MVTVKGSFMDSLESEGTSRDCLKIVSQVDKQYNTYKFVTADLEGPGQCLQLYFPREF